MAKWKVKRPGSHAYLIAKTKASLERDRKRSNPLFESDVSFYNRPLWMWWANWLTVAIVGESHPDWTRVALWCAGESASNVMAHRSSWVMIFEPHITVSIGEPKFTLKSERRIEDPGRRLQKKRGYRAKYTIGMRGSEALRRYMTGTDVCLYGDGKYLVLGTNEDGIGLTVLRVDVWEWDDYEITELPVSEVVFASALEVGRTL